MIKKFDNFTKKKILTLNKYPELFQFINKKYRSDPNLVLYVVKNNGFLLQFADLKLRDNYKIVKRLLIILVFQFNLHLKDLEIIRI